MFIIHGTFLSILGQGVLLKGRSHTRKSTLALELIHRGHQLVADDAVWFEQKDGQVWGKSPPNTQDFIHSRELGLLNVRKLFGHQAICACTELNLVVHLVANPKKNITGHPSLQNNRPLQKLPILDSGKAQFERAPQFTWVNEDASENCNAASIQNRQFPQRSNEDTLILGVNIPTLIVPATLTYAILLEVALRNLQLKKAGYSAMDEFAARNELKTYDN